MSRQTTELYSWTQQIQYDSQREKLPLTKLHQIYGRISASLVSKIQGCLNNLPENPLFLSLGCGDSHELLVLAYIFSDKPFRYIGIDIDQSKIDTVRQRFSTIISSLRKDKDINFVCADASDLTRMQQILNRNSVDFIFLRHPAFGQYRAVFRAFTMWAYDGSDVLGPVDRICTHVIPRLITSNTRLYLSCHGKFEYDRALSHFSQYNFPHPVLAEDLSFSYQGADKNTYYADGFYTAGGIKFEDPSKLANYITKIYPLETGLSQIEGCGKTVIFMP